MLDASRLAATSPAFRALLFASLELPSCDYCTAHEGLCFAHRWEVLPLLARPAWVRLMGTANTEQTDAQTLDDDDTERKDARRLAAIRALNIRHARERMRRRSTLARSLGYGAHA